MLEFGVFPEGFQESRLQGFFAEGFDNRPSKSRAIINDVDQQKADLRYIVSRGGAGTGTLEMSS